MHLGRLEISLHRFRPRVIHNHAAATLKWRDIEWGGFTWHGKLVRTEPRLSAKAVSQRQAPLEGGE